MRENSTCVVTLDPITDQNRHDMPCCGVPLSKEGFFSCVQRQGVCPQCRHVFDEKQNNIFVRSFDQNFLVEYQEEEEEECIEETNYIEPTTMPIPTILDMFHQLREFDMICQAFGERNPHIQMEEKSTGIIFDAFDYRSNCDLFWETIGFFHDEQNFELKYPDIYRQNLLLLSKKPVEEWVPRLSLWKSFSYRNIQPLFSCFNILPSS